MKILIGLFLLSTLCFAQPKVKVLFINTTTLSPFIKTAVEIIDKEINKFVIDNKANVLSVDLEKIDKEYYIATIVYE